MQRNKADSLDTNSRGSNIKKMARTILSWSITLLLVALLWGIPFLQKTLTVNIYLIVIIYIILYALLAASLIHSLSYTSLNKRWQFRLGFLLSSGLGGLQIAVYGLLDDSYGVAFKGFGHYWVVWVLFAVVGSFLGALLWTSYKEGLSEANPPSALMTQQIYQQHLAVIGIPSAEPRIKRWFDVILAAFGLFVSAPVWAVSVFLVWLEDPGPVLFVKNSVGKGGINIKLFKFRTMALEMEKKMALVQTQETEATTLLVGRLLRKTALDELPQLINILKGEMSFVGPRPHRTPLVSLYLERMPEFAERHSVLPGLAGLAQVSGDFYMTPRQKLRFDRLYIRYRSIGFDLKLMYMAFLITFWYRWKKDWNGRLPRKYLHPKK